MNQNVWPHMYRKIRRQQKTKAVCVSMEVSGNYITAKTVAVSREFSELSIRRPSANEERINETET